MSVTGGSLPENMRDGRGKASLEHDLAARVRYYGPALTNSIAYPVTIANTAKSCIVREVVLETPGLAKKTWIAHYIYAAGDGAARTRTSKIRAVDYDTALRYAASDSPADEFVVSVYPETDEQYLGLIRGAAMRMSGRGSE